jgi:hypothetical protein
MIKIKNLYSIICLSLLASSTVNASSYLDGVSDDVPFVVGKALYFPLDSDLAHLGVYDYSLFEELSEHAAERHVSNKNQTIFVQMGSVNALNTRDAGMLDVLNEKAFDLVGEYYQQDITFLCYGRKIDPVYGELLQCSFVVDGLDIAAELLRLGMAKYNSDEFNQWQNDEYIDSESFAKEQKTGVWESNPLNIIKGIKGFVSESIP